MNPPLVTLSRDEAAKARKLVRTLAPEEAARRLGVSSSVTLFRAIALWPVHPITADRIRSRLTKRL